MGSLSVGPPLHADFSPSKSLTHVLPLMRGSMGGWGTEISHTDFNNFLPMSFLSPFRSCLSIWPAIRLHSPLILDSAISFFFDFFIALHKKVSPHSFLVTLQVAVLCTRPLLRAITRAQFFPPSTTWCSSPPPLLSYSSLLRRVRSLLRRATATAYICLLLHPTRSSFRPTSSIGLGPLQTRHGCSPRHFHAREARKWAVEKGSPARIM